MAVRNNPFKPITRNIPDTLKNKFFLVLVIGAAWMIFFDKHDFLTQWELNQQLNGLEKDKAYYEEKIKEVKEDKRDIEGNKEKFAREHYYMKKKDEDVFIFVEKEE